MGVENKIIWMMVKRSVILIILLSIIGYMIRWITSLLSIEIVIQNTDIAEISLAITIFLVMVRELHITDLTLALINGYSYEELIDIRNRLQEILLHLDALIEEIENDHSAYAKRR